jgi:hypothetical protein
MKVLEEIFRKEIDNVEGLRGQLVLHRTITEAIDVDGTRTNATIRETATLLVIMNPTHQIRAVMETHMIDRLLATFTIGVPPIEIRSAGNVVILVNRHQTAISDTMLQREEVDRVAAAYLVMIGDAPVIVTDLPRNLPRRKVVRGLADDHETSRQYVLIQQDMFFLFIHSKLVSRCYVIPTLLVDYNE